MSINVHIYRLRRVVRQWEPGEARHCAFFITFIILSMSRRKYQKQGGKSKCQVSVTRIHKAFVEGHLKDLRTHSTRYLRKRFAISKRNRIQLNNCTLTHHRAVKYLFMTSFDIVSWKSDCLLFCLISLLEKSKIAIEKFCFL